MILVVLNCKSTKHKAKYRNEKKNDMSRTSIMIRSIYACVYQYKVSACISVFIILLVLIILILWFPSPPLRI